MGKVCDSLSGARVLIALSLFVMLALPLQTSALSSEQYELIFETDLSLELSPEHPLPGESVRLTASALLIDLSGMTLAWYQNGELLNEGVGLTEVSVTAPPFGSSSEISVAVLDGGAEQARRSVTIRPAGIDLLWEAGSYTPPHFRGRALPSAGTELRLEAIPHFVESDGALVPSANITYTWKRNGYVIPGISGRGQSRVAIDAPSLFGSDTISVEARTGDAAFHASASVRIPSVEPELVLYEEHPLFGIMYHRALSAETTLFSSVETSVVAVPYFADATHSSDPSLLWEWRVNGNVVENDESAPNKITIDARGSSGIARIDLRLAHLTNFFLDVSGGWVLRLLSESAGEFGDPFSETE